MDTAASRIRRAVLSAQRADAPFRHWLLNQVLPVDVCEAISRLAFAPPRIDDTLGKRETHNSTRIFVTPENRAAMPVCEVLGDAFQDGATVAMLEDICGITLRDSSLRIEYCLDTDGFWLEPHTDIGAKLFTMLVYLSDHPDAEQWGTDIMTADGKVIRRVSGACNTGLIFIPAADTWHGFSRRPIRGVRRSLIVNYVSPAWRSRHELAYPDSAV